MNVATSIERTTLATQAYLALREQILNQQLQPGKKLVVRELSEVMDLSPTPIKSALTTLTQEGLVVHVPHQGFFVHQLDAHDLKEIYELREVVEGLAARLAATHADQAIIQQLESLLKEQLTFAQDHIDSYGEMDNAFHQTLWEASNNQRLLEVASTFQYQVGLFINTSMMTPVRFKASKNEHELVFNAIVEKQPEAAENYMRDHVRHAGIALQNYLKEQNESSERS